MRRPPRGPEVAKRPGRAAVVLVLTCAWLFAEPGAAQEPAGQEPATQLDDVERGIEEEEGRSRDLNLQAAALREEIESLRHESVTMARRTQDLESEVSALEERVAGLEAERAAKTAELNGRRAQLTLTLAALQRLALQPAVAVLVGPGTPVERARGALLLEVAIPEIDRRAKGLRRELEGLAALGADIEGRRRELAAAAEGLEGERERLGELIGRKQDLHARTLGERERARDRAERLAADAEDLRDLIARLEAAALEEAARLRAERETREAARLKTEREARAAARRRNEEAQARAEAVEPEEDDPAAKPAGGQAGEGTGEGADETQLARLAPPPAILERPVNVRSFPEQPSSAALTMPVRGRLLTLYGQSQSASQETAKGITIATRPAARVVAPFDGQVVYAGDFRGYGQILIIEHDGRYHTLLAGLARIEAVVGQWFLAGEPIGVMGSPEGRKPELYLELRRTGQPINPLPWLATTDDDKKVQG